MQTPTQTSQAQQITPERMQEIIRAGIDIAGRSVLELLIKTIRADPAIPAPAREQIAAAIAREQPASSGMIRCEFPDGCVLDGKPIRGLCLALGLAPREYRTETLIPSDDYRDDVYQNYSALRAMAVNFYRHWCEQNKTLYNTLSQYNAQYEQLLIEDTTMYFDAAAPTRLSIISYLSDAAGNMVS